MTLTGRMAVRSLKWPPRGVSNGSAQAKGDAVADSIAATIQSLSNGTKSSLFAISQS